MHAHRNRRSQRVTPNRLAVILIVASTGAGTLLAALFRSIQRHERDVNAGRTHPVGSGIHTAETVSNRFRGAVGPATAALYGLIGDTLDQGRWVKSSDALLQAFQDNPEILIAALVEWGHVVDDDEDDVEP